MSRLLLLCWFSCYFFFWMRCLLVVMVFKVSIRLLVRNFFCKVILRIIWWCWYWWCWRCWGSLVFLFLLRGLFCLKMVVWWIWRWFFLFFVKVCVVIGCVNLVMCFCFWWSWSVWRCCWWCLRVWFGLVRKRLLLWKRLCWFLVMLKLWLCYWCWRVV